MSDNIFFISSREDDPSWQIFPYFLGVGGSGIGNRNNLTRYEKTLKVLHDIKISESTKQLEHGYVTPSHDMDDDVPELICGGCDLTSDKCRCNSQLCENCHKYTEDCPCSGG